MTVPLQTRRSPIHLGNGVADSFAFSFKVFSSADVAVTTADADGVETERALNTDYTVSVNADQDATPGGTITYPISGTKLQTGEKLVIVGATAATQLTDLQSYGFYPQSVEDMADRLTMILQQLQDTAARTAVLADTTAEASLAFPSPESDKLIAWNTAGDALVNKAFMSITGGVVVSDFMETLLTALDEIEARLVLDVPSNAEMAAADTVAVALAVTNALAAAREPQFKNRIFNGAMQIAQRGTSATVVAGTALPTASLGYPCVDRWYVYSTGANATAAQVAGSGAVKNRLQITGAASVTEVGIGQRIEQKHSYDLAGKTVTLSVDLANTALGTVTWELYYASTADAFGTVGTPTKTLIDTNTFAVDSTVARKSVSISIPAAATTGLELVLKVGAQTSGDWTIGDVQLEVGSDAHPFDPRAYAEELRLCRRYCCLRDVGVLFGCTSTTTVLDLMVDFPVEMRAPPALVQLSGQADVRINGSTTAGVGGTWAGSNIGTLKALILFTRSSGTWTAGLPAIINQSSGSIEFRAEVP